MLIKLPFWLLSLILKQGTLGTVCRHFWLLELGRATPTVHRTGPPPPYPQPRVIWPKMSIVPTVKYPGVYKINILTLFSFPHSGLLPICI